jgi:GNAT superfamily N-acetyltransferase
MTTPFEQHRNGLTLSTDRAHLDVDAIHDFLAHSSYWAQGRPRELVVRTIENSLCFGIYDGARQAGFARVVSDFGTFAWVCDVFVIEDYRGRGLGKWLMECIVAHPDLQGLRRMLLATRDAQGLYRQYGFSPLDAPERFMHRFNPNPYA